MDTAKPILCSAPVYAQAATMIAALKAGDEPQECILKVKALSDLMKAGQTIDGFNAGLSLAQLELDTFDYDTLPAPSAEQQKSLRDQLSRYYRQYLAHSRGT